MWNICFFFQEGPLFKLFRSQIRLQNRSKFSRRQKLTLKCQFFSKKCPNFMGFCLFLANFLFQEAIFIFLLHFFVVIICSSFPGDRILLKFPFKNRSKFSRRGTCLEQMFQKCAVGCFREASNGENIWNICSFLPGGTTFSNYPGVKFIFRTDQNFPGDKNWH